MNDRYFSRERAAGYDPATLRDATVLLVGAGTLGQNVSLNLALTQVGTLLIVDLDHWETHNATRSPAFPNGEEIRRWGKAKATVVAHKLGQMTHWSSRPHLFYATRPIQALGDAPFRNATAVVSAVDNQSARTYIGWKAAQYRVPLVEGGFGGPRMNTTILLNNKADAPCWRCNVYDDENDNKAIQLGCTRAARQAEEAGFVPAIQPTAAYQGAFMSETIIQLLHANTQLGNRQVFMNIRTASSVIAALELNPKCHHHPPPRDIDFRLKLPEDVTCRDLLAELKTRLVHPVVHLPFSFVVRVGCAHCKQPISVNEPEWVMGGLLFCKNCGGKWTRTRKPGNEIYPTLSEDIQPLVDLPIDRVGLVAGSMVDVESDGKEVMVELEGESTLPFFTQV